MGTERQYDEKFKLQAIKLAKEIGTKKAAEELGIPKKYTGRLDKQSEKRRNRHWKWKQKSRRSPESCTAIEGGKEES